MTRPEILELRNRLLASRIEGQVVTIDNDLVIDLLRFLREQEMMIRELTP